MTKEKIISLTKYMNDLTNKLNSDIPKKHLNRPEQYKSFLNNEIKAIKSLLDEIKLEGPKK